MADYVNKVKKHYLFFVSLTYSYSILRPLQQEIWRRGDDAAWFIEDGCDDWLTKDEKRLKTFKEVKEYNPIAVFAPGNYVYDFFPGVKVEVWHGYPIRKRGEENDPCGEVYEYKGVGTRKRGKNMDSHFKIRGWFDIYCSQGNSTTPYFKELEKKYGFFKVYETGWIKADSFFEPHPENTNKHQRPVIFYASTFTKGITSVPYLLETVTHLVKTKPWDWIITFHPKFDDQALIGEYKKLAEEYDHVTYLPFNNGAETYRKIDVMLCDSSSIINEVMMMDKPVVTFRNTQPGKYLLNVLNEDEIEEALEHALTRPKELMENMRAYCMEHDPYRDGKNSARVLDGVDDFIANYKGKIKRKPLNLFRKIQLRLRLKYYRWK